MNKKLTVEKEKQEKKRDTFKIGGVFLLFVVAFVVQDFFKATPLPLKAIGWILVLIGAAFIVMTTTQGKVLVNFIKEGRVELLKVVWPTRKEATQITLIVLLVVFLAGILLWGIDSSLVWGIGHLTQLKN